MVALLAGKDMAGSECCDVVILGYKRNKKTNMTLRRVIQTSGIRILVKASNRVVLNAKVRANATIITPKSEIQTVACGNHSKHTDVSHINVCGNSRNI
jgi:hypothetical protein